MDAIKKLCRVCSGRGEFDIFAPIPIYVHENVFEHKKWQQNISDMIFDATGLLVNISSIISQNM